MVVAEEAINRDTEGRSLEFWAASLFRFGSFRNS